MPYINFLKQESNSITLPNQQASIENGYTYGIQGLVLINNFLYYPSYTSNTSGIFYKINTNDLSNISADLHINSNEIIISSIINLNYYNNCIFCIPRTGYRVYVDKLTSPISNSEAENYQYLLETDDTTIKTDISNNNIVIRGTSIYNNKYYILLGNKNANSTFNVVSVDLSNDTSASLSCFGEALSTTGSIKLTMSKVINTYNTGVADSVYKIESNSPKSPVPTGMCTFDNLGNLYITTSGVGVFKYGSDFNLSNTLSSGANELTTYPKLIIPYSGTYSNILYSNMFDVLYIVDYKESSCNIDVYTTTGTLIKRGYISNIPNKICWLKPGSPEYTTIHMVEDGYGNLYYGGDIIKVVYFYICFKEDTKILTKTGYKLIQELKEGDLIKTLKNGYKPIYKIGYTKINHECSEERIKNQLYKCSSENFPEVFEDLMITGCHCILVDKYKNEKESEDSKIINNTVDEGNYLTENMYRLPACVDERTTVYEVAGVHNIYHFALENDDYYMNYGVYANGLLVESTSKRFMDKTVMFPLTY
jgi:hypothetical protein